MNQSWATSSRLYDAIQTRSSAKVRCCRKYDSHLLVKSRGSDLPSKRGKSSFWNLGGRSKSRCPPPALSDVEADFSFSASMSAFMEDISSLKDFSISTTSAIVGSAMVGRGWVDAVEDVGDGGGVGWAAAVVAWEVDEDRRDRDTRLSRAFSPSDGGPRLRSS